MAGMRKRCDTDAHDRIHPPWEPEHANRSRVHRPRRDGHADGAQSCASRHAARRMEPVARQRRGAARRRRARGRACRRRVRGLPHRDPDARERRGDRRRPRARHARFRRPCRRPHHREHGHERTRIFARTGRRHRRRVGPLCRSARVGVTQAGRSRSTRRDARRRTGRRRRRPCAREAAVPRQLRVRRRAVGADDEARREPVPDHDGHRPDRSHAFRATPRHRSRPLRRRAERRPDGRATCRA